ncbi:MAG: LptA/OstA family protein [Myxococcota bacterium]|nr:LptA/OstA family protein [Myxococcota bacterium]
MRVIFFLCLISQPAWSSPVRATQPVDIEAKHVEFDQKQGRVIFRGQVSIIRGQVKIECQRLVARYGDGGQLIDLMIESALTITGKHFKARAGHGHYLHGTGEFRLTGEPTVQRGPNRLQGSKIVVFLEDERVVIENPKGTVHVPTPAPSQLLGK